MIHVKQGIARNPILTWSAFASRISAICQTLRNLLILLTFSPFRALHLRTAVLIAGVAAALGPAVAEGPPAVPDSTARAAPLGLADCLAAAFSHNRELIRARKRIEEVESDAVVVRSRLMPQVSLTAGYDALRAEGDANTRDQLASELLLQQRLFEFGPDAASEIQLRADLRKAVFDYQDKVYEVSARVWELYHLILLKDQQIALRVASRENFEATFARQQARFEKRLASEEQKLQAELNVLEEELSINRIRREQLRDKMELLRLIGRPIGLDLRLGGELEPFAVDQDEAVGRALVHDVEIGVTDQLLDEQRRVLREIGWEYAPDLSADAGVGDGRRRAGLSVGREGGTWGVGVETGLTLDEADRPEDVGEATWSARVQARIPIFEGGARLGREGLERARLQGLQVQLRDLRASVELGVRQAYQSMLEAEETQRLQEKSVVIARRRLEIKQQVQEKGGQVDEAVLENFRQQFFTAQEVLFQNQETYISRQAELRRLMGFVE